MQSKLTFLLIAIRRLIINYVDYLLITVFFHVVNFSLANMDQFNHFLSKYILDESKNGIAIGKKVD